jgi:hypothetical protein
MRKFAVGSGALAVVIMAVSALPAQAKHPTWVDTSWCQDPLLSQPFASIGDPNLYTLAPGESADDFAGTGWTLSGGAKIVPTTLADGRVGSVLDLPTGGSATSPLMCVASDYPSGRAMVRNVTGSAGASFSVAYEGTHSETRPKVSGVLHGNGGSWSVSKPVSLSPDHGVSGWQPVRFGLTTTAARTEVQVYNLYLDPHMRH